MQGVEQASYAQASYAQASYAQAKRNRGITLERSRGTVDLMEIIDSPLGIKLARFRGEIPSPAALKTVIRRRVGMSVSLPSEVVDLRWLEPVADRLTHLLIRSAHAVQANTLSNMTALQFLSLNAEPQADVDLSELPALTEIRAWSRASKRILSVFHSRSLARTQLNGPRLKELGPVFAPLNWLDLGDCRSLRSVPHFEDPLTLMRLDFEGVTRLDCRELSKLTALERVSFTACRELENVAALLDLPQLKELSFDNCPAIDDVESLLELKGVNVVVRGRNAFYREARSGANAKGRSTWGFSDFVPPSPRSIDVHNEYYLVHPALTRPLSVPDEANEDVTWESAIEDNTWHKLPLSVREEQLKAFLVELLSWSCRAGAADITIGIDEGVDSVSADTVGRVTERLLQESVFTVSRGGLELFHVWEGLDGGAVVTVSSVAEAASLIGSKASS